VFRTALEERDVYNKRVCLDLLTRLENHGSREPTDTSALTIEHVMPQNEQLRPEWREMLGNEGRETQRKWLHRLGNLTLTGYNSTYSDRPFEEKKAIPGGFSDSAVRLNRFIRDQAQWTASEMEQRGKALAERAIAIWPPLVVPPELIEAARLEELRALATRRDVERVNMSAAARELFELLRAKVREIDDEIVELPEPSSVSYHGPSFFLEVLPRNNRIVLLLALDFNEIDDPTGIARDASQRSFFVNAQHEGGVNVPVRETMDIERAMPLIRHAHARASA
jgi:predicted transport protein